MNAKKAKKLHVIRKLLPQLTQLQNIEKYLDSVEDRLLKLYLERFPKKCNGCGKVYLTRDDYLKETTRILRSPNEAMITSKGLVAEFRNCSCGSTMTVVTTCRRDQSDFGAERRELFTHCQKVLVDEHGVNPEAAAYIVRFLFSGFRAEEIQVVSEDERLSLPRDSKKAG